MPHVTAQWLRNIEQLCTVIGDRLLTDVRQHVLVDAANTLYPHCVAASKNRTVFGPSAAVLHYAAENDLCSYTKVKKLKEKQPEPRALRREDADRLIAGGRGKDAPSSRFPVRARLAN